jgi:hypothetical protein
MEKIRMAVIRTALSDDASRPSPTGTDFEHLFFEPTPGGQAISDYFAAVSYGNLDFSGSKVLGWVTARQPDGSPMDSATYASYPGGGNPQRLERIFGGIRGALAENVDLSPFNVIVTFCNHLPGDTFGYANYPVPALGRSVGVALVDPAGWFTSNACHEIGHALGLSHSFGSYAAPQNHGEYGDPWDLMSAHATFEYPTGNATNGNAGPWLAAPQLRLKDWVPHERVMSFPIDAMTLHDRVLRLAAINHPEADGPLVLELIPPEWPESGCIYTVEFRRRDGFDLGLPTDAVLVHRRAFDSTNPWLIPTSQYTVPREQSGMVVGSGKWRVPNTGLDLVVHSIDPAANTANLRFSPADTFVSTTQETKIVERRFAGVGTYDWPGSPLVPPEARERCSAKSYEYVRYMLTLQVTITPHATDLAPDRPLSWSVHDVPITGAGALSLNVTAPTPKTISVDYEIRGNTLILTNHPDDGEWRTWVTCVPGFPDEPSKGTVTFVTFDPELHVFRFRYYLDMEYCAEEQARVLRGIRDRISRLVEEKQPLPPGGDPPWRMIEMIERLSWPEGLSHRVLRRVLELRAIGVPEVDIELPESLVERAAELEGASSLAPPRDLGSVDQ